MVTTKHSKQLDCFYSEASGWERPANWITEFLFC